MQPESWQLSHHVGAETLTTGSKSEDGDLGGDTTTRQCSFQIGVGNVPLQRSCLGQTTQS